AQDVGHADRVGLLQQDHVQPDLRVGTEALDELDDLQGGDEVLLVLGAKDDTAQFVEGLNDHGQARRLDGARRQDHLGRRLDLGVAFGFAVAFLFAVAVAGFRVADLPDLRCEFLRGGGRPNRLLGLPALERYFGCQAIFARIEKLWSTGVVHDPLLKKTWPSTEAGGPAAGGTAASATTSDGA